MALVVLLRGVNVGGHRTFRPAVVAAELGHLGLVNIGAAGTFVVRAPVSRSALCAELANRLPFDTDIIVCEGRDIVRLMASDAVSRPPVPGTVGFVTVLSRRPRSMPPLPAVFPPRGRWLLRVEAHDGRFVVGRYRRHMQAIRYLGALERVFGVASTTRNWNTMNAIVKVLNGAERR